MRLKVDENGMLVVQRVDRMGAMTLSITTLSIMTFSIMTLCITIITA